MPYKDTDEIPEEELGIALDEHIERRIEAIAAAHSLRNIYAELDTLADSHDLDTTLVQRLRDVQREVEDISSDADRLAERADSRAEEIRERIKRIQQ